MVDLPGGVLADYNVQDYLDEDERAALATETNVLGSLLSGFPEDAGFNLNGMEADAQREDLPAMDEEVLVSESDLDLEADDSLEDLEPANKETEIDDDGHETAGSGGEGSVDLDGPSALTSGPDIPLLGYGEHKERIFCFSKMFSGKGVKNFFDEYDDEDRKIKERNRQLAEEIRKKKAEPQEPQEPYDEAQLWTNLELDEATVFEQPPSPSRRQDDSSGHSDGRDESIPSSKVRQKVVYLPLRSEDNADSGSSKMKNELLLANLLRWEDDIIYTPEDQKRVLAKEGKRYKEDPLTWTFNAHLLDDSWMNNIMWNSQTKVASPPLLWDLNDPHMTFQLQEGADPKLVEHAVATVLPVREPRSLVQQRSASNSDVPEELAYYNLNSGTYYQKEHAGGLDAVREGFATPHAVPALTLTTFPLHTVDEELREFHRSRSFSISSADLAGAKGSYLHGRVNVVFKSVTGRTGTVVRNSDDTNNVTVGQLYQQVKEKAFPDSGDQQPEFMMGEDFHPISSVTVLQALGVGESVYSVVIWVLFQKLQPLDASMFQLPKSDSKIPLRPPGAFGKRKDLTGMDGHLLLMEYMEETPLLIGYPGMGFTLRTYKKADAQATEAPVGGNEKDAEKWQWKVGTKKVISKDETSPFFGTLEEGASRMAVDSPMFRSAATPYDTSTSDFLVIRSTSGSMFLREITGTVCVGQQLPLVKIPQPAASTLKDFEERRLIAYASRKLRQKSHKSSEPAEISINELMGLFPLSETVIKARLKDRCSCMPKKGEDGSYVLKPEGSLHSEHELRQLLSPEDVCAFDSTRGVKAHLMHLGVKHPEKLLGVSVEKWKLVIELLPEEKRPIARHIMEIIQTAPWAQSDGYLTWKQGRSQVSVSGPGDPSGRGLGCSFLKEPIRKTDDSRPNLRPPTGITGTGADLRKLGVDEAVKALQGLPKEFHTGINFESIKKFDRWEIIKYVRNIATAAVKDDVELSPDLAKFARHGRSTQQVAAGLKRKAEEVFKKQMNLLDGLEVECEPTGLGSQEPGASKIHAIPGGRRVRRLILNPNGTERVVYLPIERYNQIAWGGKQGTKNKRRVIEGRQPLPVVGEENGVRPSGTKGGHGEEGGPTRRPSKRSADDFHEDLGLVCRFSTKKVKSGRKGGGSASKTDSHAAGKQKVVVKKNVAKKMPPKRKPSARVMARNGETPLEDVAMDIDQDVQGRSQVLPPAEALEPFPLASLSAPLLEPAGVPSHFATPISAHAGPSLSQTASVRTSTPSRKGKTFKTKDGRRMTGRKVLNSKVLIKVLTALNKLDNSKWFKCQVKKASAPDYNKFVDPADEMWLDKISRKIKGLKYSTAAAFKEDVNQIHQNAVAYNTPGRGKNGGEIFIQWTQDLVRVCEEELDKHKDQIEEEEKRIHEEMSLR